MTGRFDRQIPIFGEDGQRDISETVIAVAGCGGLGCNVIKDLTLAGVRHFILIDHDTISESNLNRQFQYIGKNGRKTDAMRSWIESVSPDASVRTFSERLTSDNVSDFLKDAEIAVDCLDSNSDRLILNEDAIGKNIPLVHGGVDSMFGQVTVVIPNLTPCLGCILGNDRGGTIPSVSPAVSLIASLQAAEVLKLVTGVGETIAGYLLTVDLTKGSFEKIKVEKNPRCRFC